MAINEVQNITDATGKAKREIVGPLCPWPILQHIMHLCAVFYFCPTHPQAYKHTFLLCFFFFFIFPPIKFSLSVLCCFSLLSVTILLSLFISSAKLCYARCLNAPSLCSECCVSRAELKARECSTQSQAHSSVSKEPSTLLHYWPANSTDQCSLFAIIS